jgi:hypothetical protein
VEYISSQVALQLNTCPFMGMLPFVSTTSSHRLLAWQLAPERPVQLVEQVPVTEFQAQFCAVAAVQLTWVLYDALQLCVQPRLENWHSGYCEH